ncbi:MAG: phosphatase PAP2 family protein [Phycisphaerae bacterium]
MSDSSPRRWAQRLKPCLLAVTIVAAWLLLLRFDLPVLRWGSAVFPDDSRGWTEQFLLGLRDFGQILPVIVTCLVVATFDSRWRQAVAAILLSQLLAMLVCNGGKYAIIRYRPNSGVVDISDPAARSADTWGGWAPGNTEDSSASFPSGHSAAAFALGTVLATLYPRLAWLFWTLAIGCAASRFIQFFHWPSDCLAGGTIGYLSARLVLGIFGPDRKRTLGERMEPVARVAQGSLQDAIEHDAHGLTRRAGE